MEEEEDINLASEKLFEHGRRFVDSWLTNAKHDRKQRPTTALPKPYPTGPCQAKLWEIQQSNPLRVFNSANPAFNKLAALLCHLTVVLETYFYKLETEIAPKLAILGEEPQSLHSFEHQDELQLWAAKMLPFLRDLQHLVDGLRGFLHNLLLQLGSLCAEHTRKFTILQGECASKSFLTAGEGLAWLLRLDLLLSNNVHLKPALLRLTRLLQTVQNSEEFDVSRREDAATLETEAQVLQEKLLDGKGLFRSFIEDVASLESPIARACGSNAFVAAASNILKEKVTAVLERTSVASDELYDRQSILGLLTLSVLVFKIAGIQLSWDKKLLKQLLDLHLQVPLAPVWGDLMLQPASFLSQFLPSSLDGYIPAAYARQAGVHRAQQIGALMDEFVARAEHSALSVAATVSNLQQLLLHSGVEESQLTQTANTIVNALQLSSRIKQSLILILGCLKLGTLAIKRSAMKKFLNAVCQIKGIEQIFHRNRAALADGLPHLLAHVKSDALGLLEAMNASIRANMRAAAGNQGLLTMRSKREKTIAALQDAAVAVDGACAIIKGAVTSMQLNALTICLEAVRTTGSVAEQELTRIQKKLTTLNVLSQLPFHLQKATDCIFLYFHRTFLDAGLKDLLQHPHEARKLLTLMPAFLDGHTLLQHSHMAETDVIQAFDDEIEAALMQNLVDPMCNDIETHLRLLHHQLQAGDSGIPPAATDVRPLIRLSPIYLKTRSIHIRSIIEDELTRRLYDYTAVALHDWQTSVEITSLAKQRLGLSLQPPALPGSGIDPGLDLVEVRAHLPSFAAGYAYSLVGQSFTQRADSNVGTKHLMTLGVAQMLIAFKKHGSHFAVALVDSAYHLLVKQIALLSQWLGHGAVQTRIAKEMHSIQEAAANCTTLQYAYPFSACAEMTSQLNSIGDNADRFTPLEFIRRLITEIGNVIGLVRLTRLGRKSHLAETAQYVESQKSRARYESGCFKAELPESTPPYVVETAKRLDLLMEKLHSELSEELNYISLLAKVIADKESKAQKALRGLYTLLPALTLCSVEANLLSKEQLPQLKAGSTAAAFADDGFALGFAFLLKVCKQEMEARGLMWFQSVASHYGGQERDIAKSMEDAAPASFVRWLGKLTGSSSTGSEDQNRSLARSKVQSYAKEFKLLEDVFTSAQFLFFSKDEAS